MANLKEVRNRIVSVTSTQQITNAMKMVSAAKLKRATNAIVQLRPYAKKLTEILGNVASSVQENHSPLTVEREPDQILIVIVTSNRGLAGAFNANIIKTTSQLIEEKYSTQLAKGNVSLLSIGKKGNDYFARRDYKIVEDQSELFSDLTFDNTTTIAEYIMTQFANEKFDRVDVVYNEFKNAVLQIPVVEQLLPLLPPNAKEETEREELDYIIEPSKDEIIHVLIPKAIRIQLFKAVLDSFAAEHGARMTAMDKATENADELIKELKLSYNQARQAAITTELTEIVSGAAALSGA